VKGSLLSGNMKFTVCDLLGLSSCVLPKQRRDSETRLENKAQWPQSVSTECLQFEQQGLCTIQGAPPMCSVILGVGWDQRGLSGREGLL
jgi:hypothetical protein